VQRLGVADRTSDGLEAALSLFGRVLVVGFAGHRREHTPLDDAGALTKLRGMSRQEFDPEKSQRFLAELQSANDRTFAIVWGALLDECMTSFVRKKIRFLKSEDRKLLMQQGGMLSDQKRRCLVSYMAGWITERQYNDLELIRTLRNAFAHTPTEISFETECVVKVCGMLSMPKAFPEGGLFRARGLFSYRCLSLWMDLGDITGAFMTSSVQGEVFQLDPVPTPST
jgi:DNA-binding MltR family transcriptional regulator